MLSSLPSESVTRVPRVEMPGYALTPLGQAAAHVRRDVPHPIERVPTALVVDLVRDLLCDLPRS